MEIIFTKIHYGGRGVPIFLSLHRLENETVLDPGGPTDFLTGPAVIDSKKVSADGAGEGREDVNINEERETSDRVDDTDVEDINLEDSNPKNINIEGEVLDYLSSDSDLEDISLEDGSDVDEELRALRQERKNNKRRNKKSRKRVVETEEVPVRVAGCVDRGVGILKKIRITNMLDNWVVMRNILIALTVEVNIVKKI
ncbi:hypothetical protein FXO37_09812 [Capsicum annuum]|nr:hypothetical protein FXO37_09812 [Capsicum annuum]